MIEKNGLQIGNERMPITWNRLFSFLWATKSWNLLICVAEVVLYSLSNIVYLCLCKLILLDLHYLVYTYTICLYLVLLIYASWYRHIKLNLNIRFINSIFGNISLLYQNAFSPRALSLAPRDFEFPPLSPRGIFPLVNIPLTPMKCYAFSPHAVPTTSN